MTTISYKDSKFSHSGEFQAHVTSLVGKVARAWHQWQAAREIESMPIDMRKDFGWPAADTVDEHKAM